MLRSLDPNSDYTKPKSRQFMPRGDEETKRFSKEELEHMQRIGKRAEELTITRAVKAKQDSVLRDVVLNELGKGKGKD